MDRPPSAGPDRPSLLYWIKAGFGIGIGLFVCWLALSLVAAVVVGALGVVWQLPFIGSVVPFRIGSVMPFSIGGFEILLLLLVAAVGAWLVLRRIGRRE